MELEGFGASLVGRSLYVFASGTSVWIPWEFISGTTYSCKLLITSDTSNHHCLEIEHNWTFVIRPKSAKDWSCIATILKSMIGGSVLLTFDVGCSLPPESFYGFLHSIVQEGRLVLTRVWVGENVELPSVPDAIFFPVNIADTQSQILAMLKGLPSRNNHGGFQGPSVEEWRAMIAATVQSGLGIVVSDIGESAWTLFWHKTGDSECMEKQQRMHVAVGWLKSITAVLDK